jgi:hypothetical protein
MSFGEALASGLAGATTLTAVHETARRINPNAPRMDLLGERAISRLVDAAGVEPPTGERLHDLAMVGDLASNSLYYSLIGLGRRDGAWLRGAALGLAAGVGAVVLPGPLGLERAPSNRTHATQAMTIAWYTLGGLATAGVLRLLTRRP